MDFIHEVPWYAFPFNAKLDDTGTVRAKALSLRRPSADSLATDLGRAVTAG
jgi:hypothetical protein